MTRDFIEEEYPDLVRKFGREAVAKAVAVLLLGNQKLGLMFIAEFTGLSLEYVQSLSRVARSLIGVGF